MRRRAAVGSLAPQAPIVEGTRTMTSTGDAMRVDAKPTAEAPLARLGLRFTNWAERWFPDAYVFVCLAVAVVAAGALINGAAPADVAKTFGDGFWSLIPF